MEGLESFQSLMRTGNRQRRERDEARIASLKGDILTAEKEIEAEVLRREEMSKALSLWANTQIAGVQSRMEALLSANQAEMRARLDALEQRIQSVEDKFEADRERVMADLKRRNEALVKSLEEFRAAFEAEKKARIERETALLNRIAEEEHISFQRFDTERAERERAYMEVKQQLEKAVDARTKADEKFQLASLEEIAALKNALLAEEKARAAEDDDIADTLNRYVQKLQASLAIINSDSTSF